MTIPNNFSAFTFPDNVLNGPITDAGGRIMYTLTSEKRNFRSDVTTIARPDASIRRSVVLTNATVPAKKYLADGKANSPAGRHAQVFQDQEGNEYYWSNNECYEGKKQAVIAYYEPLDPSHTSGPRLWVDPEYCSPSVLDHIIITSLLMAKSKKTGSPGPARVSSDAHSSRTPSETSSSQRHGAAGLVVGGSAGVYALAGGVENVGGACEGPNDYGGPYGSGVGDVGDGGAGGADCGGADGGFGGGDGGGYGGGDGGAFGGGGAGGLGGGDGGGGGGGAGGGCGGGCGGF
ncbi:hypothetical protein FRC00_014628 [Tulasnella sp. 408]|nr:hypothetical protein FRC00_014628 [Tulasnella sp. 408]